MIKYPKISIITPSYNQGRFIEQTILSVIHQDYPNIEFIIIDGGSTDNTLDVIRRYESSISYWVSEPDKGHRYALQRGFDRATGDFVAWQNTDDYYEPNIFGKVMNIFQNNQDIDLVYGNVRFVDEDSNSLGEMRFIPAHHWLMFTEKFAMHNQATFFRRSLWDRMGGITFDDFFFDYDLFIRTVRCSNKSYFFHQILGNYRKHAGSQHFGGQFENMRRSRWDTLKRYMGKWKFLPNWSFLPIIWGSFLYRTIWHIRLGDWDYISNGAKMRIFKKHS
jgi:glycosyltransferase involved in cell wall biosynthesis